MKNFVVFGLGCLSFVYLLNFTFGIMELPDNLPIIGNLDEAAAAILLMNCLRYFGVDLTRLFDRSDKNKPPRQ
jgi:hypothetical protein